MPQAFAAAPALRVRRAGGCVAPASALRARPARAKHTIEGLEASKPSVLSLPVALAANACLSLVASGAAVATDLATQGSPSQAFEGFIQALLLIFFSELGDKTFFIALLLALQRPKSFVFAGTFGALALMTVISVLLGQLLHQIDDSPLLSGAYSGIPWDDVLAVALLLFFGIQTLLNAGNADANVAEEKEEAEGQVAALTGGATTSIVLSTFAVVFAAEWGDKSFLATIALAAATSPVGVTFGAVTGHGLASAIAVLGGGYLSKNVSASTIQYGGGLLFLAFAVVSAVDIVQKVGSV